MDFGTWKAPAQVCPSHKYSLFPPTILLSFSSYETDTSQRFLFLQFHESLRSGSVSFRVDPAEVEALMRI